MRQSRGEDTLRLPATDDSTTADVEEKPMPSLKGTKTEDNLKAAFAGESQANRRYLYFAQKADVG